VFVSAFVIFFFAPDSMILTALNCLIETLVFEFKKVFSLRNIKDKDVHAYVKSVVLFQRQWNWWIGALVSGTLSAVFMFAGTLFVSFKRSKNKSLIEVMRGSKVVDPKTHNQIMKRQYKEKPPLEMGKFLTLGEEKILVPESLQYQHFAFIGSSGSGKSTAIEDIVSQAILRGDKGIIVDLGGTYFAKFGRPEDKILSLRDPRTEDWDLWSEPRLNPQTIAWALVQGDPRQKSFFTKGPRAILTEMVKSTGSMAELWAVFQKPDSDIQTLLQEQNSLAARILGQAGGEQSDGVMGSTVLDFACLRELGQWSKGKEKFSISNWMLNGEDKSWIYLTVDQRDVELVQPLLRVWFDVAAAAALLRPDNDNKHTWLIVDELKAIGELPSLPKILDQGRKKGVSVVLGMQAPSQVEAIYGKDAPAILQGLQNKFFFLNVDNDAKEFASQAMGEHEVIQSVTSLGMGLKKDSETASLTRSFATKRLVLSGQFGSLFPLQAWAKMGRHNPFQMTFQIVNRKKSNERVQSILNHEYLASFDELCIKNQPKNPAKEVSKNFDSIPAMQVH
jgi:type IV secretory pathway TraG/TraD family ATPase VirD4